MKAFIERIRRVIWHALSGRNGIDPERLFSDLKDDKCYGRYANLHVGLAF